MFSMNKIALNIKMLYEKMGKAEKHVADWIMEHPGEVLPLSITELAEKCDCGEATIVRFSKTRLTHIVNCHCA